MDIDEYVIAVRAADSMAKAWRSDVAILSNLADRDWETTALPKHLSLCD